MTIDSPFFFLSLLGECFILNGYMYKQIVIC